MRGTLKIGTAEARPGQRATGYLPVPGLPESSFPPLTVASGREEGPLLAVLAGVHGAEYTSIEAAVRLAQGIVPDQVRGAVVIVPVVSMDSFRQRSIYVNPLDGKNPNRQFPGLARGTASQRLVYAVFEGVIRRADALIDLHGGDMIEALAPFVIVHRAADEALNRKSFRMAEVFGLPHVIWGRTTGSSYEAAAAAGIPAVLAEAGQQGILDPDAAALLHAGVLRVAADLGVLDEGAIAPGLSAAPGRPRVFDTWHWLTAPSGGLWYPRVRAGESADMGQTLGVITSVFGEPLAEVRAPAQGTVMWHVSALAINAEDALLAMAS